MTTPKVNTIKRGDSRFYVHPETGEKAPGVTSIVGMLPKPFLGPWNGKMAAEFVADNAGAVVDLLIRGERQAAVDMIKGAARRSTSGAADTGTTVHDLCERLAKGESIGRVHPDFEPYVDGFRAFLDEFSPEFVFLEETVWNATVGYAGSFDAYAVIDGERIWLDWKTTRSGVHAEVALQLAAYRHAEYLVRPDGSRIPHPGGDAGGVVHLRPEGWKFVPVRCGEEEFEMFKHLREIFRWEKDFAGSVIGNPLNAGAKPTRRLSTPRAAK